jgi:hypothetical protein
MRGTYDRKKDRWIGRSWCRSSTPVQVRRHYVRGWKVYWISDSNGPPPYDRGVFCCDPADLTHPEKQTRLFNPEVEAGCMIFKMA